MSESRTESPGSVRSSRNVHTIQTQPDPEPHAGRSRINGAGNLRTFYQANPINELHPLLPQQVKNRGCPVQC